MASNHLHQAARKSQAMGPSVRNLLMHYQLDPARIISTGPHQTLLKCDVLNYIGQNNLQPSASTSNNHQRQSSVTSSDSDVKPKMFVPNLDISGYQPKGGPESFSKIAKKLLDM